MHCTLVSAASDVMKSAAGITTNLTSGHFSERLIASESKIAMVYTDTELNLGLAYIENRLKNVKARTRKATPVRIT